jgi:adenosylmethionine-8-amino-7-oxononanoate aminotransferase
MEEYKNSYVFYKEGMRKRYPVIVKSEGVYLFDQDGKRYLDMGCATGAANIGYGHREIVEGIQKQLGKHCFAQSFTFSNEAQESLAKKIIQLTSNGFKRVWFCSGGAEANESAIKMARQYHIERGKSTKYIVISLWRSYHGNTIGALSVSGKTHWRKNYTPYIANFPHVFPAYCYRCIYGREYPSCKIECAYELERLVKSIGDEYVSAFIAEPIIAATAGAVTPPKEYWEIVRDICNKYDIVLIFDEIVTGLGRTGSTFAFQDINVVPDIFTLAKGISAAIIPLGAAVVHEKIFDAFDRGSGYFVHGYTYSGHALACAAGLAVQKFIEKYDLVQQVRRKGEYLINALQQLKNLEIVGDVRGKGLLCGIEYVSDKKKKAPFPRSKEVSEKIGSLALDKGLVIGPGNSAADGISGDHTTITPPFIIREEEMDQGIEILKNSIIEVQNSSLPSRFK